MAEKRRWIESVPTPETARTRCHQIIAANRAMQPLVDDQRRRLVAESTAAAERQRAEHILGSREYAFCLYPAEPLERLMEVPGA